MPRGYLKQKVSSEIEKKKTAVGLEVSVIVAVQNVEVLELFKNPEGDAVPHQTKLDRKPCDGDIADFFLGRKGGVHIAVTG